MCISSFITHLCLKNVHQNTSVSRIWAETNKCMNSMKLVIPLHSLYWSIHTKDESKHGTIFAFIFGVNWLWSHGVTALFGLFFHEIKCNGMTSFMEFRTSPHGSTCPESLPSPFFCYSFLFSLGHCQLLFLFLLFLNCDSVFSEKVSFRWITTILKKMMKMTRSHIYYRK